MRTFLLSSLLLSCATTSTAPRDVQPTVAVENEDERLTPDKVKGLRLVTRTESSTYCSISGADLLWEVLDGAGQPQMESELQPDWYELSTEPPGLIEARGSSHHLTSPLAKSLAGVGQDVTVTMKLKGTAVQATLTLKQDLGCPDQALEFVGKTGEPGDPGVAGRGRDRAGDGKPGDVGREGGPGPLVTAEAAWVTHTNGQRYALVVAAEEKGAPRVIILGPKDQLEISSRGGSGGRGGAGGAGDDATEKCYRGGRGALGGDGGPGGPGGRVVLRVADPALLPLLRGRSPGGDGGAGGPTGDDGAELDCSGKALPRPTSRVRGDEGAVGGAGPKAVTQQVKPETLKLIRAVLANTPFLKLAQ